MPRNVLKGSPLITARFNVFIDVLAEMLSTAPLSVSKILVKVFAEDVLLLVISKEAMQFLLDLCSNWVSEFGIKWAPTKSATISKRKRRGSFGSHVKR